MTNRAADIEADIQAEDDVDLVDRCHAGEQSAMRRLVERFQSAVFGLCLRMLGHRQDAEDTAQDVFVRAFRSLGTWDRSRPLKPWLLAIAANRCRTALGKRGRRPMTSDFVVPPESVDNASESSDLAEELRIALDRLREEYRLCFELFHVQELGCDEIGDVLDVPKGTVKTWLHRARRELAQYLERRGVVPDARFESEGIRTPSA